MKKSMFTLAAVGSLAAGLMLTTAPVAQAKPGGCLKYGAAGAAAGHMVHHGVRGFMAGCAAGMYRRHLYNKQQRENTVAPDAGTPGPATPTGKPM